MKKQLTLISILLLCLVSAFLIMSCSPGAQNTNQNSNANNTNIAINTPCSDSDIDKEMKKIIKGNGIENQHNGTNNPNGIKYFEYRVIKDGDKTVLLIQGGISDGNKSSGNAEFMENVVKAIDQLVKKDCVWKAEFVEYGTFARLDKGEIALTDIQGFDWSICEWPKIACPGGQCLESCPGWLLEKNANSNSNSNANSNTNSYTNGNRNTNTNSNANANKNQNRAP